MAFVLTEYYLLANINNMKLVIGKLALKGFAKMPPQGRMALRAKLEAIAVAPFAAHPFDVKALKGAKDLYRVRQGDWRAVYEIIRTEETVVVLVIDVRGEIYR